MTGANYVVYEIEPKQTKSMIVSTFRTLVLNHSDLPRDDVVLHICNSFKILGILFNSKFTFEKPICSVFSIVAQKIGLLRKSFKIFGDPTVLKKCFNSFILLHIPSSNYRTKMKDHASF